MAGAGVRRREPLGPWYRLAVTILKPPSVLLTRRTWEGTEHVPSSGGVIVAINHTSLFDPIVVSDFLVFGARLAPRFMAKRSMFEGRGLVAHVMRGAGQIPVERGTADASGALDAAVAALRDGRCVAVYPEGTTTRDPDLWPMRARTGVARLALRSGAPVLPLTQWGAHRVHRRGRRRVHLFPRVPVHVRLGPPVDLADLVGRPLDAATLTAATERVMADLTAQLEDMRGEPRPSRVHEPGLAPPA